MTIRFEPVTFSASGTEAITGVSTTQQRNLRRADHDAKSNPGHERKDARALAKLLVMQSLAAFKVPPSASAAIADSASAIIVMALAKIEGAVEDPEGLANEPPVRAPPGFDRWYLVWDGNGHEFVSAVDAYFASDSVPPATVVLNLRSLADTILDRAGCPLWRVVKQKD
ncbi:hypothetical protein ACQKQD_12945 [Methylobacterium sp. NPDC080182]|uniref:hypothetical protein n=1 Tax=Methylobacterium sp. NPDC080182 TaxID=3390590 RepID=UPI003CFC6767